MVFRSGAGAGIAARTAAVGAVAVLLGALSTGCAGNSEKITKPKDPLKLKSMVLRMESGANDNWPVRVDLVRTKDADLLPRLTAIKPTDWFGEAGVSFRDAHPEVYVDSWEVVPGTVIGPFKVNLRERVAGVLYCDMQSSPSPLRVAVNGAAMVTVDDDRCRLSEPDGRQRWFGDDDEPKEKRRWFGGDEPREERGGTSSNTVNRTPGRPDNRNEADDS